MPNAHKHPQLRVRGIPREEAEAFDAAATAVDSNRSAITRQLWEWFAGGAELPRRPKPAGTALTRKHEREAAATEEYEREDKAARARHAEGES